MNRNDVSIDILAISPPSFVDVNRAVYRVLSKEGWSVEIVIPDSLTHADGPRDPDPRGLDDPPLHALPLTSSNQRIRTFRGLFGLFEGRRPRILYVDSDPASILSVQAGLWARFRGAAVICQSCDNLSRTLRASMLRLGARGVINWAGTALLARAARANIARILSINEDGLRVYTELGFSQGCTVIPLGFDSELFRRDHTLRKTTRERLGLCHPTIAFFGMLRRAKGIHVLVEALEGLTAYKWQFMIDRFDEYRDPYATQIGKRLTSSSISDRVLYFDGTHKEMPHYMNAADIVVLPSIATPLSKEQYGRVISEAMACGCVVVVSRSGALPELVADAGLVVPENDVTALREALREVIIDTELRFNLATAALNRAHSRLTVRQQALIMSQTFAEVIERSRVPATACCQ